MTRARRDLSPDDLKIWRYVTRSITPLEGAARHPSDDGVEEPQPRKRAASVEEPSARAIVRPSIQPQPLKMGSAADIDRRTAQRFQRGEMHVDGRIDLHGLTLEQAHGALTAFIRGAAVRGSRCVMVVTGKGKGGSIGKIRAEAPHWLNQASLRPLILAVSQARIHHGGTGALYVLLKRQRG
jgi:DNA-nicking Smr family endonuclease